MKIRVSVAALFVIMVIPVFAFAGDVILITNKQNPVSTLSKKKVEYIFLGQTRTWEDNSTIVFAIQNDTDVHDKFLQEYIHKSNYQYSNYWKRQVFTGKGSPPRSFKDERDMIKFVSETRGAIGYVSSGIKLDNVKTISVN